MHRFRLLYVQNNNAEKVMKHQLSMMIIKCKYRNRFPDFSKIMKKKCRDGSPKFELEKIKEKIIEKLWIMLISLTSFTTSNWNTSLAKNSIVHKSSPIIKGLYIVAVFINNLSNRRPKNQHKFFIHIQSVNMYQTYYLIIMWNRTNLRIISVCLFGIPLE